MCLAIYLPGLGASPLFDPDEPVYGQTAREMVMSGSWLTPKLNGLLWFDKPPMYFWLAAASYKVFGINEFAARFPSALAASALTVLVYVWARAAFGAGAALFASVSMATSLLFSVIAIAAVTDMTLCFFMTLSFYMIYLAVTRPDERFKFVNLFYFVAGFSVLTKGPVGLVLPLIIIAPFLFMRANFTLLRSLYSPAGFGLFCLSAAPWYLAMLFLHGRQFFNTFIGYHNLIRFLEPEHVKTSGFWFYVPVILLGMYPHVFVFGKLASVFFGTGACPGTPGAGRGGSGVTAYFKGVAFNFRSFYDKYIRGAFDSQNPSYLALSFAFFMAAGVIGFFSISKTKLVTYILPAFPGLALINGYYYEKIRNSERINAIGMALNFGIGVALFYGFLKVAPAKLDIAAPGIFSILAGISFFAFAVPLILKTMKMDGGVFMVSAAAMAVLMIYVSVGLVPEFGPLNSSKGICEKVMAAIKPGERLAYYSKTPSLLFYADRYIEHAAGARRAGGFLSRKGRGFLVMLLEDYEKMKNTLGVSYRPGEISGKYIYITNN